jgi:hypothetical protein
VVTIVVLRYCGAKIAAKLGRFSVPASLRFFHSGDSGRNGRMITSGMRGSTAEISV